MGRGRRNSTRHDGMGVPKWEVGGGWDWLRKMEAMESMEVSF